jgi:nitroreductase
MNVLEAIRTKRAVRQYSAQPVAEEIIRQILDAGRLAQSSMNRQPWTFVILRDPQRLKQLAACADYGGPLAAAAFGVALVSSDAWPFDIGQAAAYLQLAAWELGVGSCLVWLGQADKAKALLGVPAELHLEMAISFGYLAEAPKAKGKASGRKSFEEVVRWEHW